MECREVQSQLIAYLLNDLDIPIQAKIKAHLVQCSVCKDLFNELKLVDRSVTTAFKQLPIPQTFPATLSSRVYEQIKTRQHFSVRRWFYKVGTVAAMVLLGLVLYGLLGVSQNRVVEGSLYVEIKGEGPRVFKSQDSLPIGAKLIVTEGKQAKIKLRDNSVLNLSGNTILTIKHDSHLAGRLLGLEQGELHCRVAKGSGFSIQMPGAELKTLGTEFIVRMGVNRKEITISQDKLLSFITSGTVKVTVSSGKVLLTTQKSPTSWSVLSSTSLDARPVRAGSKYRQEIKAGETVIRDINPPLPVELQIEIKELINQLGNENELIRQEAFAKLAEIGYAIVPFLGKQRGLSLPDRQAGSLTADSIQQPYINQLLERFSGPELLWSYEIPDVGFALHPPVVSEDQLFIVDGSGLYALDCFSGVINWEFPQDGFNSTPFVANGIIYIGTLGGYFFAIEVKEGKIIWQQTGLGIIQSAPVWHDGMLYVGSGEPMTNRGRFSALDFKTGNIKWNITVPGMIAHCQPVIVNDELVLFGTWDRKFYALAIPEGEPRWDYQTQGKIVTSPIIINDLVYFGSWDGQLYALSIQNGKKKFSLQTDSPIIESPIKEGSMLYWGTQHKIYALDIERHNVSWTYNREKYNMGKLTLFNGQICFSAEDGKIIMLDAITGQETWRYNIPVENKLTPCFYQIVSPPTIFNNVVYVSSRVVGSSSGMGNKIWALQLR